MLTVEELRIGGNQATLEIPGDGTRLFFHFKGKISVYAPSAFQK
jgi:hypothetical protein